MIRVIMMIWTLLVTVTCASSAVTTGPRSFRFEVIKSLHSEGLSKDQILRKFGEPDRKVVEGKRERWSYREAKEQRLQIVFDESNREAEVHWFPLEGEAESSLDAIFAYFKPNAFKPIGARTASKDSFDSETTFYDGNSISILRDDPSGLVEAVVWHNPRGSDSQAPMTSR